MSGLPVPARKTLDVSPPRAYTANGGQGQVAALAVSAVAIAVDLTKGFSQGSKDLQKQGQDPASVVRNCLTIVSDVDLGVIFGANVAAVSGGNAPVLATVGTLTSNVYTPGAGTCFYIPAKTPHRFLLQNGVDNAVGIVASGAGTVRLYQSSPDEA